MGRLSFYYVAFIGCLFVNGQEAFNYPTYNAIDRCIFYNQTVAAIVLQGATQRISVTNSIFLLAATGDYVVHIEAAGGTLETFDNNCYWSLGGQITTPFYSTKDSASFTPIGTGNITADPQFEDTANGNFALKTDSPCLNTGKATISDGYSSIGAWQRQQNIACRLIGNLLA